MTAELKQAAQQALEALKNITDYDQIKAARHALRTALAKCPAEQEVDLHDDIINLPCDGATLDWANTREAYQCGHRDARHAAAELVLAHAPQQATPAQGAVNPLAKEVIGCFEAAEIEGLSQALSETSDERLKDLVERRLMHALYAAQRATPEPERCKSCDNTGDVTNQIGEWRGVCNCPAGDAIRAKATPEPGDAQIMAIGEGLRSAHDHIEMHKLDRSHCKDADRIREGLAAFSAYKKRGDFVATPETVGDPTDGWLQDGGLLYRLTDGRHPENRDEINVTMAYGSRTPEARTQRASELLDRIRANRYAATPDPTSCGKGCACSTQCGDYYAHHGHPVPDPSPTAGMNLGQRIKHIGGRENAAGYIEFGSVAAVRALIWQYLRDMPAMPEQQIVKQFGRSLIPTVRAVEAFHRVGHAAVVNGGA